MNKVIEKDFGKKGRESERKFSRLMGLIEKQREEVLKDPVRFLDMASERIARYQGLIVELRNAKAVEIVLETESMPPYHMDTFETVQITKQQYECYVKMKTILNESEL